MRIEGTGRKKQGLGRNLSKHMPCWAGRMNYSHRLLRAQFPMCSIFFNPFMPMAVKNDLTNLMITFSRKHI